MVLITFFSELYMFFIHVWTIISAHRLRNESSDCCHCEKHLTVHLISKSVNKNLHKEAIVEASKIFIYTYKRYAQLKNMAKLN